MTESQHERHEPKTWQDRWHEVIFEADTPAGKLFDVVLLIAILASVLVVMLESVESIREQTQRCSGRGRMVLHNPLHS